MVDAIDPLPDPPSRSDPANFSDEADAFLGALPLFQEQANDAALAMNLNDTSDVSVSSVAIGLGAKTFTVTAAKSFLPGMYLVIADDAAPSTNSMIGQITSYSGTTLIMNITAINGSGTKSAWTISQSVPQGATGPINGTTGDFSGDLATEEDVKIGNDKFLGSTGAPETISIDSAGNVYIGTPTSATTRKFVVYSLAANTFISELRHTDATNPQGLQVNYSAGAPNDTGHLFYHGVDSVGTKFQVRSDGGIANFSANDANLSDISVKENIIKAPPQIDFLKSLKFKNFNYKKDPGDNQTGLIANDVEKIDKSLAGDRDWGTKAKPDIKKEIYPYRIQQRINKATQDLVGIVETQQATINKLINRIEALENP